MRVDGMPVLVGGGVNSLCSWQWPTDKRITKDPKQLARGVRCAMVAALLWSRRGDS